ncbi:OPT superfamily oligopeptide transporter [Pleurostoma richardsiae]|uniref:OPT superfamily oligopeptide transporter n=1 Tax=Pleurostoma richardsiae TaxID=41990 RepID=A0AA38RD65_9PEZI|nr:OPT superfamily oligopeptide transporter [Pleurostoma richardsiae]
MDEDEDMTSSDSLLGRSSSGTAGELESFIDKKLQSRLDYDKAAPVHEDVNARNTRLESYPIPLVAHTVDLHNDDTEPLLTFRFWVLSTIWVVVGCTISSVYYFKPYSVRLTGYVVQLCSWAMGARMARHLPNRQVKLFGLYWNPNPGPWNAKEHALVVVAYWGSSYTAYGLGPLSAMELYYNKRMSAIWAIAFLMTSQLMGYGIAGLYRNVLVRPPRMYYPGVLPNVALFNAMHKNPSTTSKSLYRFFCLVTLVAFVYQWLPSLIWPMLGSLPLLCYIGRGFWKTFVLGSGTYGFGLLDLSFDWNYISFFSPLYTPLWANANRFAGAIFACWILYPMVYFSGSSATAFAPMSSGTWDNTGAKYNISAILTTKHELDQKALIMYSMPRWSFSYAMHFFWGFASTSAVLTYALLFHGRSAWKAIRSSSDSSYNDPYLKLTSHLPRVPRSWYVALCLSCLLLSVVQLYAGEMQLPWWGLLLMIGISALFTLPSGILFALANIQIGMDYLSEILAGALFPGKPIAVLTSTVYGRQVLEQCLNLVSDLKFGFYMKIPERALFLAQVYGTVLGPLVNWACMRIIIDTQGGAAGLTEASSGAAGGWNALKTKNFYSLSVIWGVLGPRVLFSSALGYSWLCYGFVVGPLAVLLLWLVHQVKPRWEIDQLLNPAVVFSGAALFPIYPTVNLGSSMVAAVASMGYARRWHSQWFHRYNYLLGAGLDCGAQMVQILVVLLVHLAGVAMPHWWGNDADAVDRCFPPEDLPPNVLN